MISKSNIQSRMFFSRRCFSHLPGILAALLLGIGATGAAGAEQQSPQDEQQITLEGESLGQVDFDVSCTDAARPDFDRALALMHHMMYVEARAAFEKIIENDPDCPMAYWGVATTLFQPLWGTRPSEADLKRGWRMITKAEDLEPQTERERRLVSATKAFFRDPETADFRTRINRWTEAMETAFQAHPDDQDTAALYALSRLALAQIVEDRAPLLDEAETVLRKVYRQNPSHPGAIHYTIHATDADGRAGRALDIVESYAEIAPQVPHALHMPSHIYVRLGKWPEVIEWNQRSEAAALKRPAEGRVSHHYPHATDYILYAYLQQGKDDKALSVLKETLAKEDFQRSFISTFHLAAMPARYAVERRQWQEAANLEPREPDYLPWDEAVWAEGMTWFARGLGHMHTGETGQAVEAEKKLQNLRDRAKESGDQHFATYIEIDRQILAGWIAHAQNKPGEAVRLIRETGQLESTVEKHPVTPGALLPPYEALGDLLMELKRPAKALEAYGKSDEIWPGRYNTILGAARAAREAGEEATAREHYAELLSRAGDSKRPGIEEAEDYLEQ